MGTSAIDILHQQSGVQDPGPKKPLSAIDYIHQQQLQAKPNQDQINNFGGTDDTHENDGSFGHTLGSIFDLLSQSRAVNAGSPLPASQQNNLQAIFQNKFNTEIGNRAKLANQAIPDIGKNLVQTGKNIAQGMSNIFPSDVSQVVDYYKNTPMSQIYSDAAGMAKNLFTSLKPSSTGNLFAGLLKGFVQTPIETWTGTKVDDTGKVRPATPQEQALNLQASAALVAQISVFKAVRAGMLASDASKAGLDLLSNEGQGPIADVNAATAKLAPTPLGPIAVSGALKQGAKYVGGDVLAGAVSGAAGGAISGLGQDNQADQIISGALSFMPLTAALGVFGIKGYLSDLSETAKGLQRISTLHSTQDIATQDVAAANGLRINPDDPVSQLIVNTDAAKSGDNLVKAAIRSRLEVGDGYIVDGVSKEMGDQLGSGAVPSSKGYPENYVPPKALSKPRPRPNSTEVKFTSPFDKLAYLAAAKKPSPFVQLLVDDAMQQTGLSKDEIVSHGKYVRMQQLQQFKQGKLIPRTQAEIDAYNNASVESGKQIAAALPEGGVVKDNTGVSWTRVGNSIQNQDGSQVLPLDQNNTLQILGRKKSETPFYQPYQQLEKQTFNPNFGRFSSNQSAPGSVFYHWSPANSSLLVTPIKYTPDAINFFKQTGYMKGEVVSMDGLDHVVDGMEGDMIRLRSANTGLPVFSDGSDLRRTNYSITPDVLTRQYSIGNRVGDINTAGGMVLPSEGATREIPGGVDRRTGLSQNPTIQKTIGVRAPVMNAEGFIQKLYPKFLQQFSEAPDDQSFAGFADKFYSSNNIAGKDQSYFNTIFTKYLAKDLARQSLAPEELAARERLMGKFQGLQDDMIKDKSYYLTRQAESNGMYYTPEGGGKYRLRYADGGQTAAILGNSDEVLNFINKIRQTRGLDLDGGYTGMVPTGIGNMGGLNGGYTPLQYGKFQQAIDLARVTGVAKIITPIGRMMQYIDNLTQGKTNFYPAFLKMQEAEMNRNNIVGRTPALKALQQNMQGVLNFGRRFSSDRLMTIADNLDTGTIDDIKNRYLSRPMNTIEDNLAQEIAKTDVGNVQDLLFKTKMVSPNSSLGSQAYMTTLQDLGKTYDPAVLKAANLFASLVSKSDPSIISGDAVLRLAHAYENPSLALSQEAHARLYNMTPDEFRYRDMVKNVFKQAGDVAGIQDASQYQMYLPALVRRYAVGVGDLNIPDGFAREMTRAGITPKNVLIRDPQVLMNKYFVATVNHLSGYNDAVSEFQDNLKQELGNIKGADPRLEAFVPTLSAKLDQYVRLVAGYKTLDDNLYSAGTRVGKELGLRTPDFNSIMSLQALGTLALKPALAVRDYLNIMGLAYGSFGHEFTEKAFTKSVSPKYVQAMIDKNLMPDSGTRSYLDPGVDETSLIQGDPRLKEWANAGFKLSGQEFSYQHANAGIYQGGMEMAEKYFGQLKDGKISKDQAFNKLGISSNYGPGLIKQIDNHLVNGRPDLAADLYAQANMRYLSHVYGFHNNPLGWDSKTGRLLSQWGSWSANAANTMIDQVVRGNKLQIAGKLSRIAAFNMAMTGVGAALGFNLRSWQVSNPLTVWPNVGPITGIPGNVADAYEQGKAVSGTLENEFMGFVPYAGAAKNWVKSLDLVGQGQMLQGLGKFFGMPVLPDNQQ